MVYVIEDETSCGPLCQHPACWQSNLRREKGFYHKCHYSKKKEAIETDLPTLKIFNLLEQTQDDKRVLIQSQQTVNSVTSQSVSRKKESIRSVSRKEQSAKPTLKMVEVQQMFDFKATSGTTAAAKKYLVWVPNPNRKPLQPQMYQLKNNPESHCSQQEITVHPKDLTEHMIPKNIASEHTQPKVKRTRNRSPVSHLYPHPKYSGMKSPKPRFDTDGEQELLTLPRDVFEEVLEHTKHGDFTQEKLRDVIHKFLPPLERDLSLLSMDSTDLLQPKKISLQQSRERFRRAHAVAPTQPVFHMDDDVFGGLGSSLNTPGHGTGAFGSDFYSIRDIYFNGIKDFGSKKTLPAIGDGQENGEPTTPRLPSISLGLPEIPTGIRHTKPFTYRKIMDVDFTLGPMPTPPTSACTSEADGSDHGATIRVTIPSAQSAEEEELEQASQFMVSRSPYTPSAGTSTKLPKAPTTTPATAPAVIFERGMDRQSPSRFSKHSHHETTPSSPKFRKQKSPIHNTAALPVDLQAEPAMFRNEISSSNYKTSKSLTEIPEIPPPPSSPQEMGNSQTEDSSPVEPMSRITSETPVTHGVSSEGNMLLATPGLPISAHTATRPVHHRERSSVSSPEPWPTVHEDYYDIMHSPIAKGKLHDPSSDGEIPSSDTNANRKPVGKKMIDGRDVDVPRPPPPSPESKEMLKTDIEGSDGEKQVINSTKSVTMAALHEETVPTADFEPLGEKDAKDFELGQPTKEKDDNAITSIELPKRESLDETEVVNTKLGDSDVPEHTDQSEDKGNDNEDKINQLSKEEMDLTQTNAEFENPTQLDVSELEKDDEKVNIIGMAEEEGIDTNRADEELREELRKLEQ